MSDTDRQTETPPVGQTREADPARQAVVDRAREAWIRRLMDTSRRNNLLYFRDLKTGTLDLEGYDPDAMRDLLAGEAVTPSRLLPEAELVKTMVRLREIGKRALSNLEERGLQTLFLTLGMATWPARDDGRPPEAAVLLVPLAYEQRGREGRGTLALRRAGNLQVNIVLLHVLETEHGCRVEPETLLADLESEEEAFSPAIVFARLADAVGQIQGFTVKPRAVIGNFSFQKMAMVKDLRERATEMAGHDMIAALSGDPAAREAVRSLRAEIAPQEIDRTLPDNEFLVMNADSSQQRVIAAVLQGQDGVIQGPPGGGKSQTIANLIASLAAQGKRVLFVAEKRAALEVVQRRLEEVDLGHLALDLHGADISQRAIMQRLGQTLTQIREATPVSTQSVHFRFADRRVRLNEHVARMHTPRPPSNLSVYELQGHLLRLPAEANTALRWRGADLERLDAAAAAAINDLLTEAGAFAGLLRRDAPGPWTGALLRDGATVQQAMDAAARLANRSWPAFRDALDRLLPATGLPAPTTVEAAGTLLRLLEEAAETLSRYDDALFAQDLDALIEALSPVGRGGGAVTWAMLSNGVFRAARQTLRGMRRASPVPLAVLLAEARAAADQRRHWQTLGANVGLPRLVADLPIARSRFDALLADLQILVPLFPDRQGQAISQVETTEQGVRISPGKAMEEGAATSPLQMPLKALSAWISALAADTLTPHRLPRLLQIEHEIEQRGAGALLAEIRAQRTDERLWQALFDYAWYASCLDQVRMQIPALAGFNGSIHTGFVNEFRDLDCERLTLASARVRRAHGERVIAVMNQHKEQADLVRRETNKRARHLPLRKLLAQAPDMLTALCPCWMASPLSVSQLLDADRRYFDVVLFDEASQVLPEDAIPALLRANHVVVAGDQHQLPPTTFFADGGAGSDDDGDEEAAPTEGFESLLDLMSAFLAPWPLEWHYRSRDESLIAFSNRHIYDERLITFPGPGGAPCITHELIEQEPEKDGQEESAAAEVRRVVELIIEHATQRPQETLGVIAMGMRHARRVEAALEEALRDQPELEEFFDPDRHERFFVKNLERVQGDERDAILLTIGYGKDRAGNLPYRFGPLLTAGGERRLNVAITRARRRMTLVSSFSHQDMDPGRSKARGVELLRLYLEYATSQGRLLGDAGQSNVPLNPFEADVYDALTGQGIRLLPQWGASRFRIDFVAQHPDRPGRFVLAIECDGATYHSAPTARDRDRLRQQQLEALGWRFHRIWSTDWFLRREEEIARALESYALAIQHADQQDAAGVEPTAMTVDLPADDKPPAAVETETTGVRERPPLPDFVRHGDIGGYTLPTLMSLVKWVQSDGLLRTDDEIIAEMLPLLGFRRRGPRIVALIQDAIERSRSKPKRGRK
jgi:very-short-patch-repair endonuclease